MITIGPSSINNQHSMVAAVGTCPGIQNGTHSFCCGGFRMVINGDDHTVGVSPAKPRKLCDATSALLQQKHATGLGLGVLVTGPGQC